MGGVTVKDVTAVHQPRAGVGAPAKRRSAKRFLPTSVWEWGVTVLVGLVASVAVLFLLLLMLGWVTGGRFGAVGVVGNSMASTIPNGSTVLVVPLPAREGDYVVGWVGASDNMADSAEGDEARSLVVKKYTGGKLVSTDDPNTYSKFEYRGRVISVIPTQKILWWRDTGVQNSIPDLSEAEKINARLEAISSQAMYKADLRRAIDEDLAKNGIETSLGLPLELSIPLAGGEVFEVVVSAEKNFSTLVLWDFMAENTEVFVVLPSGEKISTQNFSGQGAEGVLEIGFSPTMSCRVVVVGLQDVPGGITSLAGITVR